MDLYLGRLCPRGGPGPLSADEEVPPCLAVIKPSWLQRAPFSLLLQCLHLVDMIPLMVKGLAIQTLTESPGPLEPFGNAEGAQ